MSVVILKIYFYSLETNLGKEMGETCYCTEIMWASNRKADSNRYILRVLYPKHAGHLKVYWLPLVHWSQWQFKAFAAAGDKNHFTRWNIPISETCHVNCGISGFIQKLSTHLGYLSTPITGCQEMDQGIQQWPFNFSEFY